ncbi:hypothetical protein SLS62_004758 [Diatrype stigma]|uniref:Uncharacterized protein n=1 Tax=Diatrype stigma TaxID=117547 RepID=A0AAN9V2E1_9PEZI
MAAVVKYTLGEEELDALSKQLLTEQPPSVSERFVSYMVDGGTEAANLARHVERVVFEERFGLDDAAMRRLYEPYETASTFFLVVDRLKARPAGTARVGRNGPAGLLTLNDAARMVQVSLDAFRSHYRVDNMDEVWDLGTTVVLREYRSVGNHLVSQICYRCFWARAMHEGVKHFVTILDGDIRRTFALMDLPFEPLLGTTGEVFHEGSKDSMFMYAPPAGFPAGAAKGVARASAKLKPFAALFKNRVFGPWVDHHLMFDISKCPDNWQKKDPTKELATAAQPTRLPSTTPDVSVSAKGHEARQWYSAPKPLLSLL